MNPIRRELLNGMFVLVLASLISAAFAAFQVSFNVQLWVWIVIGVGIAVGGYVVFEFLLSSEAREKAWEESTRLREEEWLKRVGNPARLELGLSGGTEDRAQRIFDPAHIRERELSAIRHNKCGLVEASEEILAGRPLHHDLLGVGSDGA